MIHAGTRLFCRFAFASLIFLPRVFLPHAIALYTIKEQLIFKYPRVQEVSKHFSVNACEQNDDETRDHHPF